MPRPDFVHHATSICSVSPMVPGVAAKRIYIYNASGNKRGKDIRGAQRQKSSAALSVRRNQEVHICAKKNDGNVLDPNCLTFGSLA